MYVVVLSYLLNGEAVVPPGSLDGELAETLSRLFLSQGQPPEDAVLMHPEPTVYSTHTVVPFSDAGDEVGRLLTEDPEQRLAWRSCG